MCIATLSDDSDIFSMFMLGFICNQFPAQFSRVD